MLDLWPMVHLSQVTDLCEHEAALPVSPPAEIEPVSRITSTLTPGAVVTTSKNDVDRIVTEYGIAELRGRTLSQRAKALIAVAHPDHRDRLTFEAKKRNILI